MSDDGWSSERRETVYEEARSVLDSQNDTISDIDNKTIWTVRLTAVLIGILVTGVQLAPDAFDQKWLEFAIGSFAVAVLLGIITYNESNLYVGPKGTYVEELTLGNHEKEEWDEDLLLTFAGMISENYEEIRKDAVLLTATQMLLMVGIVLVIVSVVV